MNEPAGISKIIYITYYLLFSIRGSVAGGIFATANRKHTRFNFLAILVTYLSHLQKILICYSLSHSLQTTQAGMKPLYCFLLLYLGHMFFFFI